jgi:peptide/nickel transport system substrate-binding protein
MEDLTRRNFIGIIGATAGAGVLGALATAEVANAAGTKKTLTIGVGAQTYPAAPWTVRDHGGLTIASLVGEYLAWQRVDGSLEPRIAESWKPSRKGQSWTFYLRKGVKFHDGTEVTADDVVYTFKSHLKPANISNQKGAFQNILVESGIVKVDKYTVRFDLLSPNASFPYTVSSTTYGAFIIKNNADGGVDWTKKMMSAGPWIMVSHKQNESSLFKKNLNYWAGNNASFDFVKLNSFESISAGTPLLLTDKLDALLDVTPSLGSKISKNKFNVQQVVSAAGLHVHMRCDWGPFKDKRVRQAVALAFDRVGYVQGVLMGVGGTVANDSVMDSFPTVDKSVPQRKKDLAKAKQLMKEAGVPNGFEVNLASWNREDINKLALALKASLKKINIKVNLKIDSSDAAIYYGSSPYPSVKGIIHEYDNSTWLASSLGITEWAGRGVPDAYLMREWRSTGDWNPSHINSPKLDKAIDTYIKALTPAKKKEASKLIQEASLDLTPYLVLYNANVLNIVRKGVSNLKVNAIGQIDATNVLVR